MNTSMKSGSLSLLIVVLCLLLTSSLLVAQPSNNVELVSSMHLAWNGLEIDKVGDLCYVAADSEGVVIMDVSDPYNPFEVTTIATPYYVNDVAVVSGLAFLAANRSGLRILDISDPLNPTPVGSVDTPSIASAVTIWNDHCYVLDRMDSIIIVDVSDPHNPQHVGTCSLNAEPVELIVHGQFGFLATYIEGVIVLDLSQPADPVIVGEWPELTGIVDLDIQDNYAYIARSYDGLYILDIINPLVPVQVGYYPLANHSHGDIKVEGNIVCIAPYYAFDVSDPTNPMRLSNLVLQGSIQALLIENSLIYIAAAGGGPYPGGLRIIDIIDAANPELIGLSNNVRGNIREVVISDNIAYVCGASSALLIMDISDPNDPEIVNEFQVENNTIDECLIDDNIMYAATRNQEVRIYDISDPINPVQIGSFYEQYHHVVDLYLQENLLYVASGNAGLRILDVSDPSSPFIVSEIDVDANSISGVVAIEGFAFATDWNTWVGDYPGIHIYDVSDLSNPIEISTLWLSTDGSADLVIRDNYLYVAAETADLRIIDVSDPYNPVQVGIDDPQYGNATEVELFQDFAFVADGVRGLRVVDVQDPYNPVQVGYYDTPGHAVALHAMDQYVYVADINYLHIFDHSDATFPPSASLTLAGINTVIPAGGGTLSYDAHFVYGLPYPTPGLAYWAIVETPAGTELGPFIIQPQFTANPGMDITVFMSHQVPAGLPAATYTYTGHIGIFPTPALQDNFTFTKEGAALSGSFDWSDIDLSDWSTSNGFSQLSADGETAMVIPTSYSLEAAYPNPFNASTTIHVNLPESAELNVAVYNLLGQRVALLADGRMNAGRHSFSFDGHYLASGVYLIRAIVPGEMDEVQKIALLK
jgi:hypothetical protein